MATNTRTTQTDLVRKLPRNVAKLPRLEATRAPAHGVADVQNAHKVFGADSYRKLMDMARQRFGGGPSKGPR